MTKDEISAAIDKHAVGSLPKWPQMLVTGKPVTVDQAKEIIFRTDGFLHDAREYAGGNNRDFNSRYRKTAGLDTLKFERQYPDGRTFMDVDWDKQSQLSEAIKFVKTSYVHNSWASSSFIFGPHGWCHPNGTISYVDNVGKWPSIEEIYDDWVAIAHAFPYVDAHVTLMSGEQSEDAAYAVINFRVLDGKVTIEPADSSVHSGARARTFDPISFMTRSEQGLPNSWVVEYAERIKKVIDELAETA